MLILDQPVLEEVLWLEIENCLLTFPTVIGSDIRDNFAQNVIFFAAFQSFTRPTTSSWFILGL